MTTWLKRPFIAANLTVLAAFGLCAFAQRNAPRVDFMPQISKAGAYESRHTPQDAALTPLKLNALAAEAFALAPPPKPMIVRLGGRLQCAPYARSRSGLALSGNARSWWSAAAGLYKRDHSPSPGAVMVMGGTRHGHVAVVVEIRSKREILIDHANWMNQGEIQMGALVRDVSAKNDWSAVRVWYPPINDLGNKPYPVYGFILNGGTKSASL